MSGNFAFLSGQKEYALFAAACLEAERVFAASPAMCAIGCRKALELAIKWVYAADTEIKLPYRDNLQALLYEYSFKTALDTENWQKLPYIVKLGNHSVHTAKSVSASEAMLSLRNLFEFIQWLDYCYGQDYEERTFVEALVPQEIVTIDKKKIQAQESLLLQKDSVIQELRAQIAKLSVRYTKDKKANEASRRFQAEKISEFATRKRYIDVDLKLMGWTFGEDVREEVEVTGMLGKAGQKGYVDYVLFGKNGLPLAVVEAKRTSKDPNDGKKQVFEYASCLEKQYGRRPLMFYTNGFETYFWDDLSGPPRKVSGVFSRVDLERLLEVRRSRKALAEIVISDSITDRYYQKEAIRAICGNIETGYRKHLLVMATGTGKTRTAASLTDVLSRGNYITNVLFLADRTALVEQAKEDFHTYLPDMSLCNLLDSKDKKNARIVFSTYPTMLNAIDSAKTEDGKVLFTPAHFDLLIIDEAHRSIFKKYKVIFEYFDALIVGLTATPKTDVDSNTYDFFELEPEVPTYAYDYQTAVKQDQVLVPYYNIEVTTKFLEEGISYDELSEADKERYEEDFTDEEGEMPDFIPSPKLNDYIFNQQTVDLVLQDLMTRGIKTDGGDKLGKTIIFAQNKNHAQYIVERFDKLYPQYKGTFMQRVVCDDKYAQDTIKKFKLKDSHPYIAVSVDMLDTGIDVPHVLNLVYFKKVRSKIKFWQMLGRGTRRCEGLECVDTLDGAYLSKRRFYIFDYLGNFEFFRVNQEGVKGKEPVTLSEAIFRKRVALIAALQESAFAGEEYQAWRESLVKEVVKQLKALNDELVAVRLQKRYVERYRDESAFVYLNGNGDDKNNLCKFLAPLVYLNDNDEFAKRFDSFMYGLMLVQLDSAKSIASLKNQLCKIAENLAKRMTIPQVKEKRKIIKTVLADEFWQECDVLRLENIRIELRELIKFTIGEKKNSPIYTALNDLRLGEKIGEHMSEPFPTSEEYKLKVNRYIENNKDHLAIYKLRHNIRLDKGDYQVLANILTRELGSAADYRRTYEDLPFGLLVRKIAKMERPAAMAAFSEFINDQSLSQQQIVFVQKIIDYIVQNGYIDSVKELLKPPFDKPQGLMQIFDGKNQEKIIKLVKEIKDNAVNVG